MKIIAPKRLMVSVFPTVRNGGIFNASSLDLQFARTKTLDPRITFTRASSGTYVGADGLIKTATTNEARFDHNPTTGESLGLLVEESRTNLLVQSNGFDTTWTNNNSSETSASGTAPDGTNTAWELKDTSDVSFQPHSINQSVSFTSGTTYTFTVWMKAGTLTEGGMAVPSAAFGAVLINRVNLSTGAVISTSANSTTVVTPFANGWYQIALTATATATASSSVQIRPMNGGTTYIGTGTGTVLIWGAQLEVGAFPTSYIPTTTATVTRSADVASITGANFGTTRTNLLLRSEDFSTTWSNLNVSVSANSTVAPDGTITADTIDDGAVASAGHSLVQTPAIAASTTYAISVFVKNNGRRYVGLVISTTSSNNYGTVEFDLNGSGSVNRTSAVGTGFAISSSSITNIGNGWFRCAAVIVTGSAAVTDGRATVYLSDGVGTFDSRGRPIYSGTNASVYLWGAQLEVGSIATAYIPTTTAAVSVFDSSWYRQDEGTVFSDWSTSAASEQVAWAISNGTLNESIRAATLVPAVSNNTRLVVIDNNSLQVGLVVGVYTPGSRRKTALAYQQDNFAGAADGAAFITDTSGTLPTVDRLSVGANWAGNGNFLGGPIRRLTYWPQRLSNSTLQQITQ
jgi:hypothetical protein